MYRTSFHRLTAVFSAFVFFAFSFSAQGASALWIAESKGAIKVAGDSGEILFEIPQAGGVDGIAVDNDGGRVWTLGGRRLKAYDTDGTVDVDVAVPPIHKHAESIDMLADAGGVWLAARHELFRFDAQGQLQNRISFRRPISGMTLDTERGYLWVAVPGHVFIVDQEGNDVDRFRTHFPLITQLDYDADLDNVWLVAGPYLLRLNAADRELAFVSRFGVGFKLWRHLSADGQGGVWGADPIRLSHVNAAGEIEFTFQPFQGYHGKQKLQDLAASPEDGSVWLANETTIRQYSIVGAQEKELTPDLGDGIIRSINRIALSAQTRPPELTIAFPTPNSYLNTGTPTVELRYSSEGTVDTDSIEIKFNDNPLTADCTASQTNASCTLSNALQEGEVTLTATLADTDGNVSELAQVTFTVDTLSPIVTVTNPAAGLITNAVQLTVSGTVNEPVQALTLNHNGDIVSLQTDGNNGFSHTVTLSEGGNTFTLTAIDNAGNSGSMNVTVTLDTVIPVIPDLGSIRVTRPDENGNITINGQAGSVEPGSRVTITNTRTGESIMVTADSDGAFIASIAAQVGDDIQIITTDAAGNTSEPAQAQVSNLPPDPATIAPAIDPTQVTLLIDATAFLYSGSSPIQTGVQPGTMEAKRVAVIRGKVLDKQNNPLQGVAITVKDHPEFGQTVSRADGMFDLAVNGGGALTLNYEKADYLPIQRQVETPWRDYTFVDDAVMIQLDPKVTTIDLAGPTLQVAQGTPQIDEDGTRQATLFFPPGTTATMTLPDGALQTLTTLNVRATEYTVSENGPEAMPAVLPPTSGYTYAVELSVDEAIAANATKVVFNQPIPFYVDNFLNFPTGETVPVGYYDREKAAWIPSDNGRIIEILAIDNGLAVLDVNGGGNPADPAQLAELGITDAERQQLATLYQSGKTLWRAPVTHFTPWDCNWPFGPPEDAETPNQPESEQYSLEKNPCIQSGSIIECQNRALRESIDIIGTPFSLNYHSDRVLVEKLNIKLSGPTIPGSLKRIELSIRLAGRHYFLTFPAVPNQSYKFTWDGKDAYGRFIQGSHHASIQIGYVYPAVYYPPDKFEKVFGRFSSVRTARNRERGEVTLWQSFNETLKAMSPHGFDLNGLGMGGWTLSPHHFYDMTGHELRRGDGRRRAAENLSNVFERVAGGGRSGIVDGQLPAKEVRLNQVWRIKTGADGSLYFLENRIWDFLEKVRPDGIAEVLAGQSVFSGPSGNGGRAKDAFLEGGQYVAVGPDGSVYIPDLEESFPVIRRITPDGIIDIFAGGGNPADGLGDGLPAHEARLWSTGGSMDVGPDGSLYLSQGATIRRIGPDGIINTIAGNPTGRVDDGVPALEARIAAGIIDYAPDGSLYFVDYADGERIRRIAPDGTVSTVAGNSQASGIGDGGPATQAHLEDTWDIAVASDGGLYIAQRRGLLRYVNPEGIINTIIGGGTVGSRGDLDGLLAAQIDFDHSSSDFELRGIAVGPDDTLYLNYHSSQNSRIYKLSNLLPEFNMEETLVTSEDGTELYRFQHGRHIETLDLITNTPKYRFFYDANGLLIEMQDINGDITRLVRDAEGAVERIVSPDGLVTQIELDDKGHLIALTHPDGTELHFSYMATGQLTRVEDPRDNVSTMTYDSEGFLEKDENAGEGSWTLTASGPQKNYTVTMTSALGRILSYQVIHSNTGVKRLINTSADGTSTSVEIGADATKKIIARDGTSTITTRAPDPRFGMQSPTVKTATVETPAGLTSLTTTDRSVRLSDPGNLLSLKQLTDTITINGRAFRNDYNALTRTFTFTSPEGRTSTRAINERSRPINMRITGLAPVDFGYDVRGRLEQIVADDGTEQRLTQMRYYDSGPQKGFLQSITDAENRTVRFEYDSMGRVTKQILPDSREIQYGYDANGNVTSIQPPGRPAHVFNYNAFNLKDEYTPPVVDGISSPATDYDYNLDKELIRITRPDGQQVNFTYNSKAQMESMTIPRGTYAYGYNPTTGKLDGITAPDGGVLTLDNDGFLPTGQTWAGDISGSVTQRYNNNFLVSQRCVNSDCVSFGYDNDNMLTDAGSLSVAHDPQRAGLITGTAQGNVTTSQDYNTFGELASFDAEYLDTQYFQTQYVRDRLGRITQKSETIDGVTTTEVYGYDQAGRLETVHRNGTFTTYAYDSNGNRLSKTTGADVESGIYDNQDRLLSYAGCSYTYTDNGELRTKICGSEVTSYEYDVLGNLISVSLPDGTNIEYVIDGQNRRIGKKVNGTLVHGWLYADQLNPIAELNADGSIRSRFVYGTKINVPDYMVRNGVTYRIISNHLGSPRLVINTSDGSIVQRMDYDEFGNVIQDTNPGFQPFGFAGGIYDPNTGLVRFGARDYSVGTGRWTAKDPIGFNGGDVNLFGYVINDPVNFIDPSGNNLALINHLAHLSHLPGEIVARASPWVAWAVVWFVAGSIFNNACDNCFGDFGIWVYNKTHPDEPWNQLPDAGECL